MLLFSICSAIPLGLFAVTVYGKLGYLGVKAGGPSIALRGGILTAAGMMESSLNGCAMAYPGVAADAGVIRALYYIGFGLGGVGYSVPLGLLIAGISVPAGFARLLPRWVVWSGLALAVCGELCCLDLLFPKILFLIPLTRFPGFVWLIISGFMLAGRKPYCFR